MFFFVEGTGGLVCLCSGNLASSRLPFNSPHLESRPRAEIRPNDSNSTPNGDERIATFRKGLVKLHFYKVSVD